MSALRLLVAPVVAAAALSGPPNAAAADPAAVLVVGDSLEVGTGPYLRRELRSVPLTLDARRGRTSSEGVGVLRRRLGSEHGVVVFDLGTNDEPSQPAALARDLAAARELAGERCIVVATLSRPPSGVSTAGLNRVIEQFVAATPKARLVDWHAATAREPALLGPDGVHARPSGYARRARLVAREIDACREAGDGSEEPADSKPAAGTQPAEPRTGSTGGALGLTDVLALVPPYETVAAYVQRAFEVILEAMPNLGQAIGRRPPEPKLGAPGS